MGEQSVKKYIIKKALVNALIIILGAFFVAFALRSIQQTTIKNRIENESFQILNKVSDTIKRNRDDVDELTDIYHKLNQSTVKDLKEVMDNGMFDVVYNIEDDKMIEIMKEMVERSNSPYLFVMDEKGTVLASPSADLNHTNLLDQNLLSKDNLNKLLNNDENEYVKEENSNGNYYFYSAKIDTVEGNYYLIYGTDTDILDTQFNSLTDITRIIRDVEIGNEGFLFAVNNSDNSFVYFEDGKENLSGENAFDYGLKEDALKDQYVGNQKINGTEYFCVAKDCGELTVIVAANNIKTMYRESSNSWKWSIAGFIAVSIICLLYATIVRNDFIYNERDVKKVKAFELNGKQIYFNSSIFKRITPVIILGIILIFSISYYSCTLLDINKAISNSSITINELENNFDDADVTKSIVKDYYENQYLAKARILAYLFEEVPEVLNQGKNKQYYEYDENNIRLSVKDDEGNDLLAISNSSLLQSYCKENNINAIYIFDEQGRTIATNLSDWYFKLSFNETDQSYPFREVLDQKIDYYIQESGEDEVGREAQYIGTSFVYYTTINSKGETEYVSRYIYETYLNNNWNGNPVTKHNSLLQIALNTEIMDNILASTEYEYLLAKSTIDNTYLVLFDDTDDHIILYSPKEKSVNKKAEEIGLGTNAFNGNYIGFQKANGIDYLINIQYYQGYYIGTAILKENLFVNRAFMALTSAAFGFIFIMFSTLLITLTNDKEEEIYEKYTENINDFSDRIMFIISTPSGENSVTERAVNRWDNKNIPWKERTPEQKLSKIFFIFMAVSIINILLFTYMVDKGKVEDTVLSYIISGNWDKGFNVFALTSCGLVLTGAIVLAQLLNIPIHLTTKIFGTKSETIGHLLASVIKYGASIYSLFYCLYLLGFDSTSLLTSAGILSLVIGLGSQSLIKDVVAGIFIIFEGSFRVGDIVTIGGYRGQVLDVGLRTTKIMSADHNIKIINNNDVNGVINMTRVSSLCTVECPIPFGVDVDNVEEVLAKELPLIKERVKGIIDGPYYNGVISFDQKKIVLQISVLCKENDIFDVKSGLNREIIDIIQDNGLDRIN